MPCSQSRCKRGARRRDAKGAKIIRARSEKVKKGRGVACYALINLRDEWHWLFVLTTEACPELAEGAAVRVSEPINEFAESKKDG